jgi:protein O-GlcNAc transferase
MPLQTDEALTRAQAMLQKGKLEHAARLLKQLLNEDPNCAQAYHYLGLIDFQHSQFASAVKLLNVSIELDATDPVVHNNLGLTLLADDRPKQAIAAFDQSLAIDPFYTQALFNRGNAKRLLGDTEGSLGDYDATLAVDPYMADALNNRGIVLRSLGHLQEAIKSLEHCLDVAPKHHLALNNLGLTYQRLGENEQALKHYQMALQIQPMHVESNVNAGNLLQELGRFDAALNHYVPAYKRAPQLDLLLGNILQCKAMLCDWKDLSAQWKQAAKFINAGFLPCSPFVMLSGNDSLSESLATAQRYANRLVNSLDVPAFNPAPAESGKRLRIGYLSSDFRAHPVGYLTAGVIEQHNRQNVEVFGFALTKPGDDEDARRICRSFDTLVDLSALCDTEAINVVRNAKLDIAIDLTGYTAGARPALYKSRVAPIQVGYYGYPGTMGSDFMDYLVADPTLIPSESRPFYTEKILYLPDCYLPNHAHHDVAPHSGSRSEHGLPEQGFVFCCFNKPYKITPSVFESWMAILNAVPHSVLWLQSTDALVIANLQRAARKYGVRSERIIFAGRTPTLADHLARYRLADLFLDTYPYTAHTTGNDVLWVGLPLLGLSGETFSARVSESLLNTLGLHDLVCRDLKQYERRAIDLALDPAELATIRDRLASNRVSSSLYKPDWIAKWLENGLRQAYERYCANEPPEHIIVTRETP